MAKTWKIYVHQNKFNGKLYIGQTSEDNVKRRWHGGVNYYNCPRFYNAIKKYGWDNFNHIVLIDNISTLEEANEIEKFLIAKYDTTNKDKGYNLSEGGSCQIPNESRIKQGESLHQRHEQKPEVQKVNELVQEKKDLIQELKQNSSIQYRRGNVKPVICIETQVIYESSAEAERETGIRARAIRSVCTGDQKTTNKLHWAYYEEGKQYTLPDTKQNSNRKSIKVYCPELEITFNSASEAARHIGINSAAHILECCRGVRQTCQGMHWQFVQNKEELDHV